MSLFHDIIGANDELYEALVHVESDEKRDEYLAGIEHNNRNFCEAWDAYSRLLHPQFCTSTGWGCFREVTGGEVLINVAFGERTEFRLYGDMTIALS